jgi:sugar (pentulose or hexulose) kinase
MPFDQQYVGEIRGKRFQSLWRSGGGANNEVWMLVAACVQTKAVVSGFRG